MSRALSRIYPDFSISPRSGLLYSEKPLSLKTPVKFDYTPSPTRAIRSAEKNNAVARISLQRAGTSDDATKYQKPNPEFRSCIAGLVVYVVDPQPGETIIDCCDAPGGNSFHGITFESPRLVKPGGILVYSTCSIDPEEDEERVAAFLLKHLEFSIDPVDRYVPADFVTNRGFFFSDPVKHSLDGSFAARLVQSSEHCMKVLQVENINYISL